MQQRRGTASQWTAANPVLAAGEIGVESDTNQFKLGNGTMAWADLPYFKNFEDLDASGYIKDNEKGANGGVAPLDMSGQIPVSYLQNLIADAPSTLDTLNEIADAITAVDGEVQTSINAAIDAEADARDTAIASAIFTETGLRNQAIENAIDQEVIDRNAAIATAKSQAETSAQGYVDTHSSTTTNVHGISNTANLVTKTGTETLTNKTISAADNTVTINLTDVIDVTASASEVNILDGATLSTAELNYVDGVTSSIQTQLDSKAPTANPTFTGTTTAATLNITGNLTVGGTTTTVNATDLVVEDPLIYIGEGNTGNVVDLGLVSSFNDGTYQHSGIVRDATDNKWKLFRGVTDEPTTTVNFAQATFETLRLGGVEFSDGEQTKQGVPSITPISQKTGAYTTVLTDRDSLIEVNSATGVTITIPTNASVAYPVGTSFDILQTGAGQVTIAGAGGVTVNATPGLKLRTQWSSATLFKRATDTWVVFGDLTT